MCPIGSEESILKLVNNGAGYDDCESPAEIVELMKSIIAWGNGSQ